MSHRIESHDTSCGVRFLTFAIGVGLSKGRWTEGHHFIARSGSVFSLINLQLIW